VWAVANKYPVLDARAAGGPAWGDTSSGVSEENLELVRSIYERWEQGDYSSNEWADPEIEFSAPGGLDPDPVQGVEAMGRQWADWLGQFEHFSARATEFLESGDQVVVLNRFGGQGRTSGVPMEDMPGAARFRIRDGKVIELAIYVDPERGLRDARIER
jgi:ketosteroid isomerase-like protein